MTDYNKFSSPSMAGTILTITPHTPQSPASAQSHDCTMEAAQLAHTYHFPEVAASSLPDKSDAQFRELEIVRSIAVGQAKAQVVLCKAALTPGQQPTYIAAKIFDIRCYGQDARDDEALTVFARRARVDYSREAAAYQRIKAHELTRPSLCTLDYFGACSFQLIKAPLSSSEAAPSQVRGQLQAPRQIRTVNMLLLEYIEGRDLHNILYGTERLILDDEYRLGVWARFAECEIWLKHIGIRHEDIYEHNVMVTPAPNRTSKDGDGPSTQLLPRVILIDFGEANLENLDPNIDSLPQNPVIRHWSVMSGLGRWCPRWFAGDTPRRRRWMMNRYGQDARWQKVDQSLDLSHLTQDERDYMSCYGYR